MKINRTKVIQLMLGFALTLGLMLGLSGPAMAQMAPQYQEVSTWEDLQAKIKTSSSDHPAYIKLGTNLSNTNNPLYVSKNDNTNITNKVYLDLAGHTLSRSLSAPDNRGYVIGVANGGQLTLEDSTGGGKITGGWTSQSAGNGCGGGVYVGELGTNNNSTFTMKGGTIEGNRSTYGGGVCVGTNGTFHMEGGTIQDNTSDTFGGGVYLHDSNSAFTMSGGMIGSEDSTKGNHASSYGGGVYNSSSNVTFTMNGGTISNNSAASSDGSGGGVFSNGPFIMNNNAVIQNNHASHGGGVYLSGTDFTMNDGTISGNEATSGGGVYLISTHFTMNDGTIQGNTAGKYGGGVFFNVGTFSMSGGAIQGNTASASGEESYGGGVYISGGNFTMQGGIIGGEGTSNTATNGGGVYVDSGTFTMSSTTVNEQPVSGTISGNTATENGGGVYITKNGNFTMNQGTVENNTTTGNGGGVCINNGSFMGTQGEVNYYPTFNMDGGTLSGNHATGNGGGVCNTGGTFDMTGGNLQNNAAGTIQSNAAGTAENEGNGGGVYIVDYVNNKGKHYSGTLNMSAGTISGNTATQNGGGVYVSTGSTFNMNPTLENGQPVSSGTISGNTATENGGGVFIGKNVTEGETTYNSTFNMTGGTIGGNQAGSANQAVNGGGVYVSTGSTFNMNPTLESGQPVSSGTISGNTASENGGGVYNTGTFAMTAGTIGNEIAKKGNHAANGGGVYNGGGSFTMGSATGSSPCTISGNTADIPDNGDNNTDNAENVGNGGGVFIAGGAFTLNKGTIQSNTATANGGGIYSNINLKIGKDAVIQSNTAENGGGVYVNKGAFTVSGSTIQYNNATNGGGVYAAKSGAFTVDSTTGAIQNNEATNGGGVYIAKSGSFNMTKGTIQSNKATANGGGIYSCVDFSIGSDARIQSNNATNGGGVYVNTGDTFTMSGGAIDGNTATENGGGVYVNGGAFTLNKGTINDNKATANGGGVYVNGGTFTLSNGTIQHNTAGTAQKEGDGGGVYVKGSFNMSGGAINGNTATNGGGVYVAESGTFTLSKGSVQSNTATQNGGGVYIAEKVTQGETTYNSTFNMTGGTIQSNEATNGGGVYVNGGSFTMTGGYLENNSSTQNGGGIYAATNIKLNGNPTITDNKVNSLDNNVYLAKDVKIDVGENLQPPQRIGVTISKLFDIITTNAKYENSDAARLDFRSDDSVNKEVYKTLRDTQARLGPKIPHTVTLVGGNHATSDGPTTQEKLTEPMQPVTYTADYGYQFPQSSPYYTTTDGITVQRTGQSTVTVSGEPTANVTVTVPDAVPKSRVSHTVTFKVEHGAWDDGTTEDKTVTLTGYVDETLRLKQDQIPAVGDKPDHYYKAGNWDTVPSPDTPITEDMTYTYTYEKQAVVMPTLYFAAHVQNYGWDKKNQVLEPGKTADVGTTGQSLRVEDLAVIVPKDLKVDGYAHVQNVGDMAVKKVESTKDYTIPEGYVAYEFGTTGKSQRVEAVCVSIKDPDGQYITGFQYAVHLQNYGWQGYVRNGSFAGTRGMSLRVEALRFVYAMPDVVRPGEPK